MKIWVAAGGTGGHLYPALAVVEEMERSLPEVEARFAVSRRGLESRILSGQNRTYTELYVEGFHRREILRNLLLPVTTLTGLLQSIREVIRFRPNVAFGTGGFVSGPALMAARLARVPVALIALDAFPGITIRMLAPLARKIFITHEGADRILGDRHDVELTGTPVRMIRKVDKGRARERLGLPVEGLLLFVTGGSQGSLALNSAISEGLTALLDIPQLSILWQCGTAHYGIMEERVEAVMAGRSKADRGRVVLYPFLEEMNLAWSAADLALCRAGASTIAELTGYGVASLLVPLPTAAGAHQDANACAMAGAGAAVLLPEKELSGEGLASEVSRLGSDSIRLEAMSAAASRQTSTDAAGRIAGGLVEIARGLSTDEREKMLSRIGGVRS